MVVRCSGTTAVLAANPSQVRTKGASGTLARMAARTLRENCAVIVASNIEVDEAFESCDEGGKTDRAIFWKVIIFYFKAAVGRSLIGQCNGSKIKLPSLLAVFMAVPKPRGNFRRGVCKNAIADLDLSPRPERFTVSVIQPPQPKYQGKLAVWLRRPGAKWFCCRSR